jgi:hypothetical protein
LIAPFPNTIDITNLIGKKMLVSKTINQSGNFGIRSFKVGFDFSFDFLFLLGEIVIELIYEFLTFFETGNVSPSSTISLILNHGSSWLTLSHLKLVTSTLDLGFIDF